MKNSKRFRFTKIAVTAFTVIFLIVIVLTYFLFYQDEAFSACAQRLMIMQFLIFIPQLLLNYFNFRSQKKIVVLATLFISSMLLAGVLSSFFNFRLMCGLFPMP